MTDLEWAKTPYRCELCESVILDQERMIILLVQRVRRKMGRRTKYVSFPAEFPNGTEEVYLHESCFFLRTDTLVRDLYQGVVPSPPRKKKVRSRRR